MIDDALDFMAMVGIYAGVVAGTFGLTALVVCGVLRIFGVI